MRVVRDQRVTCGGCFESNDEDGAASFDFGNRVCHGFRLPKAAARPATVEEWSEPGAVVHVVSADHGPGELLSEVVFFIGILAERSTPTLSDRVRFTMAV